MAENLATHAWLLVRGKGDRIEVLGIFKSKAIAEENRDCDLCRGQRWQVRGPVPLLGWGFIVESGRTLSNAPISCPSFGVH
jgi:hypothetical protein